MDILKRLEMANAATQPVRALWIDHLSVDCQMFVCEAATLFRSGSKFQLDEKQEEAITRALEHGLWQAGYRLT